MSANVALYKNRDLGQLALDLETSFGNTSIPAGENHIGQIGGKTAQFSGTFSRPANVTPYDINDVVSSDNLFSIEALRVFLGSGYLTGLKLVTNKVNVTPRFRIHFFTKNPASDVVKVDNTASNISYTLLQSQTYLGYYDMPAMISVNSTDSSYCRDQTMRIPITNDGLTENLDIYCLLQTLDAFTPSSGQGFTLTGFVEQN